MPDNSNGRMCQTVTEESLSQFQLDKLAELRAKLGDQLLAETPLFNDNFSLLRWLDAWDYRIEEILPRFKKASSVFRCMRINDLLHMDNVDAVNEHIRSLTPTAAYYPGGLLGFDREGNLVAGQQMGRSHPKELWKCGPFSDMYRQCIVEAALIYQLIRLQEAKHGRKLGIRVIVDFEGISSDHFSTSLMKVHNILMKTLQDMFPDALNQLYGINAHPLVKTAFTMMKPMIPEKTRKKIVILDGEYQQRLAADIGPENVFPRWGGTKRASRGHPEWGTLRQGGMPPDHLRYSPSNPNHMPDEELRKLTVPARQRREIEVAIPAATSGGDHVWLNWFMTTSSEVDFGLFTADGENKEVWPMFRLLTDFVPEYGAVRVECGRNYKFVIDNSFSVFTKKEVKFGYKLNAIEQEEEVEYGQMEAKVNGQEEEKMADDAKMNN